VKGKRSEPRFMWPADLIKVRISKIARRGPRESSSPTWKDNLAIRRRWHSSLEGRHFWEGARWSKMICRKVARLEGEKVPVTAGLPKSDTDVRQSRFDSAGATWESGVEFEAEATLPGKFRLTTRAGARFGEPDSANVPTPFPSSGINLDFYSHCDSGTRSPKRSKGNRGHPAALRISPRIDGPATMQSKGAPV